MSAATRLADVLRLTFGSRVGRADRLVAYLIEHGPAVHELDGQTVRVWAEVVERSTK